MLLEVREVVAPEFTDPLLLPPSHLSEWSRVGRGGRPGLRRNTTPAPSGASRSSAQRPGGEVDLEEQRVGLERVCDQNTLIYVYSQYTKRYPLSSRKNSLQHY